MYEDNIFESHVETARIAFGMDWEACWMNCAIMKRRRRD